MLRPLLKEIYNFFLSGKQNTRIIPALAQNNHTTRHPEKNEEYHKILTVIVIIIIIIIFIIMIVIGSRFKGTFLNHSLQILTKTFTTRGQR